MCVCSKSFENKLKSESLNFHKNSGIADVFRKLYYEKNHIMI